MSCIMVTDPGADFGIVEKITKKPHKNLFFSMLLWIILSFSGKMLAAQGTDFLSATDAGILNPFNLSQKRKFDQQKITVNGQCTFPCEIQRIE